MFLFERLKSNSKRKGNYFPSYAVDGSRSEGLSTLCAEAVSHGVTFAADRALLQNISTTCTVTHLGFIHMMTVDAVVEDRLATVH